jgi:acid phosphatase
MIPYSTRGHYDWSNSHKAIPIRGVVEFIAVARELGVEVFFVTNRPCDIFDGVDGDCPMEAATIDDIEEIGIDTDSDHVLLADEIPAWDREKVVRREYVAATHRVIMLFGDDYGDFVACSRAKPVAPCTIPATRDSRAIALETYKDYWGNGWYILPNPMHGSWTSVE